MRALYVCAFVLAAAYILSGQESHRRPDPRDLQVPEVRTTPSAPPTDPVELRRTANELAALAQSVPSEVEIVTHGQLPKDLPEKLKRIEKLAKKLRSQVSP